jgi:hypothetical protein
MQISKARKEFKIIAFDIQTVRKHTNTALSHDLVISG